MPFTVGHPEGSDRKASQRSSSGLRGDALSTGVGARQCASAEDGALASSTDRPAPDGKCVNVASASTEQVRERARPCLRPA